MTYHWNGDCLGSVLALPAAVVDTHIRLAGAAQLKVLLWFARHGDWDAAACSAALGLSPADCADAMLYWQENGVVRADGQETPPAAPAPTPPPQPASPTPPASIPRPRAVKPQMGEVLERQKSSPEFKYLLQTASARLGHPISHGDMETLLYLFDTAGLPAEVILMAIAHAVSLGKTNMRYIEKVALDWADRDITTIAAAEEHLCALERRRKAWEHLAVLLELPPKPPTAAQLNAAEQWICDWKTGDELIRLAYEICVENTGKFQPKYMTAVMEQWRAEGLTTAKQVMASRQPPAKKTAGKPLPADKEGSSLSQELDNYEQWLRQQRPVYKKKE